MQRFKKKKEETIIKDFEEGKLFNINNNRNGLFDGISLSYDLREKIELVYKTRKKINNKISQLRTELKVYQKLLKFD